MRRRPYPGWLGLLLGGFLLAAGVAAAQGGGIERFYGSYVGEAVSESGDGLDKRDINAEISPQDKGFKLKFTVVLKRGKDKPRRDEYTITFVPSKRPNIYSSAMRTGGGHRSWAVTQRSAPA